MMSGSKRQHLIPSEGRNKPPQYAVHLALCTAQVIFGFSAVVGTIGLPSFHPLTFALVRESSATMLLITAAHFVSLYAGRGKWGVLSGSFSKDWVRFTISGLGIFLSQAFYIVGIKLSTAVAASVWQPSQPIITCAVCMIMGWEPYSFERVLGIIVAFLGCAIMVMGGGGGGGEAIGGGDGSENGAFSNLMGQVSFFINCCGSSLYVLASKRILATGRYESVSVTAWSYAVASILMAVFATVMSWSETVSQFICADCEGSVWNVPQSAIPALVFFIIMTSSCSYGLITWSNKYASSTLVIGYTVTQPVASAIMIQVLISLGLYEGCAALAGGGRMMTPARWLSDILKPCLDEPDRYTLFGALGVFTGLMVIIYTEPKGKDLVMQSDDDTQFDEEEEEEEALLELTGVSDRGFLDDDDDMSSLEGQD